MLDLGSYLLGAAQIVLLVGFAWLGATAIRRSLLREFTGPAAHLSSAVIAVALLIWSAELLGTLGTFEALPYLCLVGVVGVAFSTLLPRVTRVEGGRERTRFGPPAGPPRSASPAGRNLDSRTDGNGVSAVTLVALVIAAVAVVRFAMDVKLKLGTGMTGFDSTWYHGPFAAGFMQTGDTWSLHYIAPQFLAWFYPANSELLHAVGMNAFDRDLLSPLLNLGWFVGCLFGAWCLGRPYRVAPWSLAFCAIALSVPALSDQAGEARNDIVGIFFLLAAVAIAVNCQPLWPGEADGDPQSGQGGLSIGALLVAGLAVGLAAGTKLNFLLPCAVFVVGLAAVAPPGRRLRAFGAGALAALAGGGYWYLRNLLHTGNPLPWFEDLHPISLPGPDQALGGREQHSVVGYLTDGTVWSDWLLPGLHKGLWILWPLLVLASLAGLVLALQGFRRSSGRDREQGNQRSGGWDPVLAVAGLAGLAAALAWLIAPTSASGPEGMPRGFESGLRYLAPALVLGAAMLPTAPSLRARLARLSLRSQLFPHTEKNYDLRGSRGRKGRQLPVVAGIAVLLVAVGLGYAVQRQYLRDRYADPTFTTPGLNAAFGWAAPISGARIATTSTRQYPLFGTDLSNRVEFVGEERPHGGFVAPSTCRAWRRLLAEGGYDYVIASRDRVEPGLPPYPATARWTEAPGATTILRKPPTVIFKLNRPPDPSTC